MDKKERLEEIKSRIETELECPLKDEAKNIVFGKGNPHAEILFIGEAPGAKEDEQGIPFVGAAGRELDKLLHSIGLSLEEVYIANILKYRPPNNRDPLPEEIARHTPYLIEQIKTIQPKVILTLGNFSTKFVLSGFSIDGMKKIPGVSALHGKVHDVRVDGMIFRVMPLYHPAAMLYKPPLRAVLEEDFQKVAELLGKKTPTQRKLI